jgi:hypothetical protein
MRPGATAPAPSCPTLRWPQQLAAPFELAPGLRAPRRPSRSPAPLCTRIHSSFCVRQLQTAERKRSPTRRPQKRPSAPPARVCGAARHTRRLLQEPAGCPENVLVHAMPPPSNRVRSTRTTRARPGFLLPFPVCLCSPHMLRPLQAGGTASRSPFAPPPQALIASLLARPAGEAPRHAFVRARPRLCPVPRHTPPNPHHHSALARRGSRCARLCARVPPR